MEIAVIGHPSHVGGADTELDHQIYVWRSMNIPVHIIHTNPLDQNLKNMNLQERGCIVHEPRSWHNAKDKIVISYCNGEFLKNLEEIRKYAKIVCWVNCMTWLFPEERKMHEKGYIDWFIYQTDHAREKVQKDLIKINSNFNWYKLSPYFHTKDFPYIKNRKNNTFKFGRISREDTDKFNYFQMHIYNAMFSPKLKEGLILGWNQEIQNKIGKAPNWIKTYRAGGMKAQDFYKKCETIIMTTDTYENLPRVAFEAMSSGSLLVVDDRGGWKEQIQHGQTGWLCKDHKEFAYYSSRVAFEEKERKVMIENARDWLTSNWGLEKSQEEWRKFFNHILI